MHEKHDRGQGEDRGSKAKERSPGGEPKRTREQARETGRGGKQEGAPRALRPKHRERNPASHPTGTPTRAPHTTHRKPRGHQTIVAGERSTQAECNEGCQMTSWLNNGSHLIPPSWLNNGHRNMHLTAVVTMKRVRSEPCSIFDVRQPVLSFPVPLSTGLPYLLHRSVNASPRTQA